MEVYFLSDNFEITDGPIDELTSVVWTERYFEPGTFTLHLPRALYSRASGASYVCAKTAGGVICGRVEHVAADGDGDCEMGGHLLEVMLADRVMTGGIAYSGTLTEVVRNAVSENLRSSAIEIADELYGIDIQVSAVSRWGNLSDWLYALLRPYGASYTVRLGDDLATPIFSIVCGTDRSASADGGGRAVFSTSFGNISSVHFEKNTRDMKNVAYVKGSDGTVITVDKSGGGEAREIYKLADDIVPDSFSTEEEYTAALKRRGEEVLAEYPCAVSVEAECDADALPEYRTDYALGDICDVADDELGLSFGLRLTSVDTVYENGKMSVHPTFGDEINYVRKLRSLN